MRFKFDPKKSDKLRKNPKRSTGFEEAQEIWTHPYYFGPPFGHAGTIQGDRVVKGELYSVIFDVGEDADGEYHRLITLWKATKEERKLYEENS